MQTFLPHSDFVTSAQVLDYRRLGKQRVEAYQILRTLNGQSNGWKNHPATKMWEGYETALGLYLAVMVEEWVNRGYKNNIEYSSWLSGELVYPKWLGDERLHSSHRAALLFKSSHYAQFGWEETPELNYFWPGKKIY